MSVTLEIIVNNLNYFIISLSILISSLSKQVQISIVNVLKHNSYESSTDKVLDEYEYNRFRSKFFLKNEIIIFYVWLEVIPNNIIDGNFNTSKLFDFMIEEIFSS